MRHPSPIPLPGAPISTPRRALAGGRSTSRSSCATRSTTRPCRAPAQNPRRDQWPCRTGEAPRHWLPSCAGRRSPCRAKIIIRIEVLGWLAFRTFDLGMLELPCDRSDNTFSYPILQVEDIVESALEAVGPKVHAGRSVDELPCYSHAVPRFTYAAF